MAAIGQATKHGIIIKSGEALEKMGKTDTVAFVKNRTVTNGKPEVSDMIYLEPDIQKETVLSLLASAEVRSEHPLGKAIVEYAKKKNIPIPDAEGFRMEAGRGIYAFVLGITLLCGNEKYLKENGIDIQKKVTDILSDLRNQGKASILIAADGRCIGAVGLSDVLRPTAKEMVEKLCKMDTSAVLLTGDNRRTAEYFARQVGIAVVKAELLPPAPDVRKAILCPNRRSKSPFLEMSVPNRKRRQSRYAFPPHMRFQSPCSTYRCVFSKANPSVPLCCRL
jgi:Cu+-exporting ATPase